MSSVEARLRSLEDKEKSSKRNIIALWVSLVVGFLLIFVLLAVYDRYQKKTFRTSVVSDTATITSA